MPFIRFLAACALAFAVIACTTVEGTGRSQFIVTSAAEENRMGADAYQEVMAKEKVCTDPAANAMIKRIGERLAKAADPDGRTGFKWEFVLLESDTINAFCLPGGKVAFYTGILAYCQNEAGIATVMGHEIAHAVARHGGERMTQGMLAQGVQVGLGAFMQAKGYSENTTQIAVMAGGLGAQFGYMLPFSRKHEYEADYLGTRYMAIGGYDPVEATRFWSRFAQLTDGGAGGGGMVQKLQAFASTHPMSSDRSAELEKKMGEMRRLYEAAAVKSGVGEPVPEKYRMKPAAPAK